MSFERYRKKRPRHNVPVVKVTAAGVIYLNLCATREAAQGHRYADLYFDTARRVVGVLFLDQANENSYTVFRADKLSHCARISCAGFIREWDIRPSDTPRPLTFDPKEKIWTFRVGALA